VTHCPPPYKMDQRQAKFVLPDAVYFSSLSAVVALPAFEVPSASLLQFPKIAFYRKHGSHGLCLRTSNNKVGQPEDLAYGLQDASHG